VRQNIHPIDRVIRTVLGAAIISLVFLGPQTAWGYLGLISVLTALSGFCPVYRIFGVRTCSR